MVVAEMQRELDLGLVGQASLFLNFLPVLLLILLLILVSGFFPTLFIISMIIYLTSPAKFPPDRGEGGAYYEVEGSGVAL